MAERSQVVRAGAMTEYVWDLTSEHGWGVECDLPSGFADRWAAAKAEVEACQDIMEAARDESQNSERRT